MVVYLGYVDQQVKNEQLSWNENKIGGSMDLMANLKISTSMACKFCTCLLYHVLQIYCPLVDSQYHRTLNIFLCFNQACKNKPESMLVLRSQFIEKKKQATKITKSVISTDDWGMNDWNTENDNWNEDTSTEQNNITEHHEDVKNFIESTSSDIKTDICDVLLSQKMEEKLNINTKVTALASYYIYVLSEADAIAEDSVDYEMQLYKDYVDRVGEVSVKGNVTGKGNEGYEKTKAKHGDDAFYTFKKVVSKAPQQILRYDWNGRPLIYTSLSKPSTSFNEVPNCHKCHSKRTFELQLMPHFITCLNQNNKTFNEKIEEEQQPIIEFGCIYVYSCKASCWDTSTEPIEEFVITQNDPDDDILNKQK